MSEEATSGFCCRPDISCTVFNFFFISVNLSKKSNNTQIYTESKPINKVVEIMNCG